MAQWTYAVSWSKFKLALDCPKQLEYAVTATKVSDYRPDYYATLGKTVQYVFEKYFMQGINLVPKGRSLEVMNRVVDKVFESDWFKAQSPILYVPGKSEETLRTETKEHVEEGFRQFVELDLIDKKILSEQKWRAMFSGFNMFGILDFLYEPKEGIVELYDGKGHSKKNADPRQILYYALILHASGKKVRRAGFLYWQHGFEEIDVSPKALKDFVDGDFARGRAIMDQLKLGQTGLPAVPASQKCWYCNWSSICTDSLYQRPVIDHSKPELVSLGEK